MQDETGGRPKMYVGQRDPLVTKSVRLTLWHIRQARRLGGGNESEGIRRALEKLAMEDLLLPRPERKNL